MAASSSVPSYGTYDTKSVYRDIETGDTATLYPGIGEGENYMRWGFIRKVYGILSVQVLLTVVVASFVVFTDSFKGFITSNPAWLIALAILPLGLVCALHAFHRSHPLNMILLALFTVSVAFTVGLSCSFAAGPVVLQALILTAAVVVSLTAYTFWASRRGQDFSFLGPMLFASLMVLLLWGVIQIFFPMGDTAHFVYSLIGAIIFAVYIVYDTDNLIKRFSYDEYILASVALYMDIVNLFLHLLNLLSRRD
eukprot:TRINITY_DN7374_c0_g1_i1.p1 TRINITY_DN7374_c0_g1~~TRINITY_DN7374_c0_g1_i1.p1  ORF type:complete len:252 (-),score=33.91 TRINITY_DN7374_c0_g1_i1:1004-1759(-)